MSKVITNIFNKLADWLTGTISATVISGAIELVKTLAPETSDIQIQIFKAYEMVGVVLDIVWWLSFASMVVGIIYNRWRTRPKRRLIL